MDDKDDPYNKSYPSKSSLPPFSTLKSYSFSFDDSYRGPEQGHGYESSQSTYQHQQQLYSYNPYPQSHPSQYQQHSQPADCHRPDSTGGLMRKNQSSQLMSCQPYPFHGSSTHGSHFLVKDQSQCFNNVQHTPFPDMSLTLPFSSGQPGMLGRTQFSLGIENFSDGHHHQSNTDHPPQIPLSQVESLLSEAEQKPMSDFSMLHQTLENHNFNSSWQSSYEPGSAKPSGQLPSFNSFSLLYPVNSNTKDMYCKSALPTQSESYINRSHISGNGLTTPTSALPGCTSQFQMLGNPRPRNYFMQKNFSENNCNSSQSSNVELANHQVGQSNMAHILGQNNSYSQRSEQLETCKAEQVPVTTKGGRKNRKKKKVAETSLDTEVKSITKRRKPKASKKAKLQTVKEPLTAGPRDNSDTESTSPAFCLSPTFIASLSSKRASETSHADEGIHSGHFDHQKSFAPQRNHPIPEAQMSNLQNFYGPGANMNYLAAQTACQNVSSTNQFLKVVDSQVFNPSLNSNVSFNTQQVLNHQAGSIHPPSFKTECKPSDKKVSRFQVNSEEEENSLSPYQLSPGFIASLSSKKANDLSTQTSTMPTTSFTGSQIESHSKSLTKPSSDSKSQLSNQPSSVCLAADHTFNDFQYYNLQNPFEKQVIPPTRIQHCNNSEMSSPWNSSNQKSLLNQPNFKTMPRQMSSPKQYASPPSYPQGSEFQYPTPPMDDDESKLQSPGLCLSPKFQDNQPCKLPSTELFCRLSPNHDENMSVLPTPPNSAGPKQPFLPDINLSKEEQTSRILEIIAREREKVSATAYQSSMLEPKKKKKKKRSSDVQNSGDCLNITNNPLPKQMEAYIVPYCSEQSADNENSYQNYPEMQKSLQDNSDSFGTFASSASLIGDMGTDTPLNNQYQLKHIQQQQFLLQKNSMTQFDAEKGKPRFSLNDSESFQFNNVCNKYEIMEKYLDNIQGVGDHSCINVSKNIEDTSFNEQLYRFPFAKSCQDNGSDSHDHVPHLMSNSALKESTIDDVKPDPYAFDDSEQADMSIVLKRHIKPLTCISQSKQHYMATTSQSPHATETRSLTTINSNVPFISAVKPHEKIHFQQSDNKFFQPNYEVQSSNSLNDNKSLSKFNCELNQNIKSELEIQHNNQFISNLTQSLKDKHQNVQQKEQKPSNNAIGPSFLSQGVMVIKEESQNKIQCHKYSTDSFNEIRDNAVHDQVKLEVNEQLSPAFVDNAKKKRGRPSKDTVSPLALPKPKVPKLKLNEKKIKVQPQKKLVYCLNGTEVNQGDLNLNQDLVDRLTKNLVEVADCSCLGLDHNPTEATEGPYYTQLGAAKDIPGVRKVLELRTGLSGPAIRIEKVIYTGKEGKSKEGCPIAKWIIRRSGPDEKYLCIVRKRPGHFCDTSVIIMVIVAWEGVDQPQADHLYDFLINTLPQNGLETDRRCGLNEKKTCACQGVDLLRRGASFSFGCSWSMYYNGCKFARSQMARKFKLKDINCEDELEDKLQKLATDIAPLYKQLAPDAFRNQTQFEKQAYDCRLGSKPGRPFSGVTAVVDFCCHSHRDCHNMNNGSTVVVNLTKHHGFEKPEDEQYHVLPMYILDQTDENGSMEGQITKIHNGYLEVLSRYMSQVRRRSEPYRPCQRNRTTPKKQQGFKRSPKRSKQLKETSLQHGDHPDKSSSKRESNSEVGLVLPQNSSSEKACDSKRKRRGVNMTPGVGLDDRNPESMSYSDLMSQQGTPGFGHLYSKFWDFFYTHGEFPPCEWISKNKSSATSKAARSSSSSDTFNPSIVHGPMLQHLQWQLQEQRKLLQCNIQNESQSQQQESQRQQKEFSYLAEKEGINSQQSSIPQFHNASILWQLNHSNGNQHDTYGHNASQAPSQSSSCLSSASPQQGSTSLSRQLCIPIHTPPSTSPALEQHSSPPVNQSHLISCAPTCQSENNKKSVLAFNSASSNNFNRDNMSPSVHSSLQNTYNESSIKSLYTPAESCDDHSVKPPPPYHNSVLNQHNMQHGPQENFHLQGPLPPTYSESLAQSANNVINNFTKSQEAIHSSRFTSNNKGCGPQFGTCMQSFNHSIHHSSNGSSQTQIIYRPRLETTLQNSFCSDSNVRSPSTPLNFNEIVTESLPAPSLDQQSYDLQRPPSALKSPIQFSAQSMERPQSVSENSTIQSTSQPISLHKPNGSVQSQQKPYILNKMESHVPLAVKKHELIMPATKPVSEHSTIRSLSLHNAHRGEPFHSALIGQQSLLSYSEEMSPSQTNTNSSHWLTNKKQCQVDSCVSDSLMLKSVCEHNDADSLKSSSLAGNYESCLPETLVKPTEFSTGRERSRSRMSEPATTENVRPPSCSSEPGIVSDWRTEINVAVSGVKRNKQKPETWSYLEPKNNKQHSFNNSPSILGLENTITSENSEQNDCQMKEASILKVSSCFAQSGMPQTRSCSLQSKEIITTELNNKGLINGQLEVVCPNGPVIGEKMKINKSEGFVVPRLGQGPSEPPYEVIDSSVTCEEIDDNREAFNDPAMGGVAIALCHGAVIFEVAKRELHATTALKEPNRYQPKRISLVFYQHKNLNMTRHGFEEYERKIEEKRSRAEQARLIEDMESKGFLKGELSELASFPNLTKGTFGKVFNFSESKDTLFPLHFPRYLDSSHSEQITPVMFACMSIAFPKYMKEAFPNPAKLPRLIATHMAGRMHSSLSDKRRDFKQIDLSETGSSEVQFIDDIVERNLNNSQRALNPWNINTPQDDTMTTDRVITRWVHDDVSVTGPYNRWLELAVQDTIKKEEIEAESEADLKEKMFESLSQLDNEALIGNRDMRTDRVKYPETTVKSVHENQDSSTTIMIINLESVSRDLSIYSDKLPAPEHVPDY